MMQALRFLPVLRKLEKELLNQNRLSHPRHRRQETSGASGSEDSATVCESITMLAAPLIKMSAVSRSEPIDVLDRYGVVMSTLAYSEAIFMLRVISGTEVMARPTHLASAANLDPPARVVRGCGRQIHPDVELF